MGTDSQLGTDTRTNKPHLHAPNMQDTVQHLICGMLAGTGDFAPPHARAKVLAPATPTKPKLCICA
jgi:hypothetical protein